MRGNIREFVRVVAETLTIQQPVVEMGAFQVAKASPTMPICGRCLRMTDYTGL